VGDQAGFAGAAERYLAEGRAEAEHHGPAAVERPGFLADTGDGPAAAAAPNPVSPAAAATQAAITYMSPPASSHRVTARKRLLVQKVNSR
jgi:D-tyrosyl-tRNA(Tyr) deacylase